MLQRIETMEPSSTQTTTATTPIGSANSPTRRKRTMERTQQEEETTERAPLPRPKRLKRSQKIYPPKKQPKNYNDVSEPWWMRMQIGGGESPSFNSSLSSTLDLENGAFSKQMRSTSFTSATTDDSDFDSDNSTPLLW